MTFAVRAITTVVLLTALVYITDLKSFWDVVRASAWELIISTSLACFVINLTLLAVRWRGLLMHSAILIPFWKVWCIQLRGTFINTLAPSSIGGDAYKLYALTRQSSHPKTTIATSLLIDRMSGLAALLTVGGLMFFGNTELWLTLVSPTLVASIGLGVFAISAILVLSWCKILRSCSQRWWYTYVLNVHNQLRTYRCPSLIIRTVGLSILTVLTGTLWLWTVLIACGATISFTTILLVFSLTQVVGALPISINGLGVSETVLVFLLSFYNVPTELTLAAALVIRASLSVLSGLGYLILTIIPTASKQRCDRQGHGRLVENPDSQ